jgi:hypothetical protein
MMGHMLDALDNGEDIGHYGRLVFAMIGHHFVSEDELVKLLTKDPRHERAGDPGDGAAGPGEGLQPAAAREDPRVPEPAGTSRSAPIPTTQTPAIPYQELQFPDEVYESIQEYREGQQTSDPEPEVVRGADALGEGSHPGPSPPRWGVDVPRDGRSAGSVPSQPHALLVRTG